MPERLAVPAAAIRQWPPCVVHRVRYGEINKFVSGVTDTLDVYDEVHRPLTAAVGVYLDGGALQVVFEGPYPYESEHPFAVDARMGASRRAVPRRPFLLAPGEWGQIRYMGRYVKPWTAFTYYEKWVCNIGLFPAPSPRVFLDKHPRRHYNSMPDVW